MTREVNIWIRGTQCAEGQKNIVETNASGEYFYRNGKHYVFYEEEQEQERWKNQLVFDEQQVDIKKYRIDGNGEKHKVNEMRFKEHLSHISVYETPAGPMEVRVETENYRLEEQAEEKHIFLTYRLCLNGEYDAFVEMDTIVKGVG